MTPYAIEFRSVEKSFRRKQVLSGASFTVERGKTFAFLGRKIEV
jgi:ABC-type multidrug transport system ATPase subunit